MQKHEVTDPLVLRLIEVERDHGLTGTQMAVRLGISHSTWSRLKSGHVKRASRTVADRARSEFAEARDQYARELQIISESAA